MSRPSQVPPQFPTKAEARRAAKAEADAAYRVWVAAEARAQFEREYAELPRGAADVVMCRRCGAVVLVTTVHNQFHDRLDRVAEQAYSALQRNEVI